MCHNILSMPMRWHKMYWKESLTIKGSAGKLSVYFSLALSNRVVSYLKHYPSFICLSISSN